MTSWLMSYRSLVWGFLVILFFGCAGSLLLHGPSSSCRDWGLLSSCAVRASHCSGFPWCRAWALGHAAFSSCGSWPLDHRLSGRGAWA